MTDQQRADLRKSEGFPCDTMPFLDSMALKGQDFSRAYTPTPFPVEMQGPYRDVTKSLEWTLRASDNGFNPPRRYRYKRHEKNYMWDKIT